MKMRIDPRLFLKLSLVVSLTSNQMNMKVLSQDIAITKKETTLVELEDGRTVVVLNFINEKGKVDDTFMSFEDTGVDLEYEGEEGELREQVEQFVEEYVQEQEKKG